MTSHPVGQAEYTPGWGHGDYFICSWDHDDYFICSWDHGDYFICSWGHDVTSSWTGGVYARMGPIAWGHVGIIPLVNDPGRKARILFQEPKSETTFLFEGGGSTDRLFSWCG